MNKNLKIIISLILISQLIIPVYLLGYHYSVINYAVNNAPEYKFDLEFLHISDKDNNTLFYEISGLSYRNKKVAITNTINDFAIMTEYNDKKKTDNWFTIRYYSGNTVFSEKEYTFEPGADTEMLKQNFSENNLIYLSNGKFVSATYITAKIYKGVFIPTALYYEGRKILTFSLKT